MTNEQAQEIIRLLRENNSLLDENTKLLRRQISLFEQYDAEILLEEEEARDQITRQRTRRS